MKNSKTPDTPSFEHAQANFNSGTYSRGTADDSGRSLDLMTFHDGNNSYTYRRTSVMLMGYEHCNPWTLSSIGRKDTQETLVEVTSDED